ncbi:chymotrypsin-2-like [Bacillus rossius redtenbacheri]|uniref:chymotrypsin-2-like n=1 Tax=Bacillus rossius redtenbacheri TaxID=93214 RepID=UPI002FDCD609
MIRYLFLTVITASSVTLAQSKHLWSPESRIFNGEDAKNGEFPFMVSLRDGLNTRQIMCGGAIISEYFILTAGHCVEGNLPGDVFIVAGVTNLQQRGKWFATTKMILHPEFNRSDYIKNDIGLMKVNESFVYTDVIKSILLPSVSEYLLGGIDVTAIGWGYSAFMPNFTLPNQLQKVALKTVDTQTCQSELKQFNDTIYGNLQICVEGAKGTGMCYGDSGSPLVRGGDVVGLVSWGIPCANGVPDIFTRVSHYVPWIQKQLAHDKSTTKPHRAT